MQNSSHSTAGGPEAAQLIHAQATGAAAVGYYVCPVRITLDDRGKKQMAPPGSWQALSTNDPQTVDNWFRPGGPYAGWSYLIDTEKSGVVVVDLDTTGGKNGPAEWAALHGAQTLMSVRTRSGGYHGYYAADPDHPVFNSTGLVAPGVDTRGVGGLVFAPGSFIEGHPGQGYSPVERWLPPSQLPRVPAAMLLERMAAAGGAVRSASSLDLHIDPGMARHRLHQAAEIMLATPIGGGLNTAIWRLGAEAGQFAAALEADEEFALDFVHRKILEHAEIDELDGDDRRAAARGVDAGMMKPWVFQRLEDLIDTDPAVAASLAAGGAAAEQAATGLAALFMSAEQIKALAPPTYVLDGLLVAKSVARLSGASGSYKSFGVLGMAGAVCHGGTWAGKQAQQGTVWLLAAEGVSGLGKRITAWEQHHGRAFGPNLRILPKAVQLGVTDPGAAVEREALIELAGRDRPALIIVDTQARHTVGVDENSNTDMGHVMATLDRLKEASGACVLVVHHTGHGSGRARGASSMFGAMDTEIVFERKDAGVTVSVTKQKDDEEVTGLELSFVGVQGTESGVLTDGSGPAVKLAAERWDEKTPPVIGLTIESYNGPARDLTLDMARWMAHNAAFGTAGRSRAEAAVALGRKVSDGSVRRAWDVLVSLKAVEPVSGSNTRGHSFWVPEDQRGG